MVDAKTGVATHINKIASHAHLTRCHGHALQLAVGETIKVMKIMRDTLDTAFELNRHIKYSMVQKNQILFKKGRSF